MAKKLDLIEIMRSHFASSKRWLRLSIGCNIGVVLLSIPTSLSLVGSDYTYVPVALLLIQIGAFVLRELSIKSYSFAESVRRLAMFRDGLGIKLSDIQWKRLIKVARKRNIDEPPYLGHYYDSKLPQGPERLLQILTESCFYTESIAHNSFRILITITAINILVVITLILVIVNAFTSHSVLLNITLLSLPILSFWATGDVANMGLRFHELHKVCSDILLKCDELQRAKANQLDVIMRMVDDYNCALSASLPLPTKFYESEKVELNKSWASNLKS